MKKRADTPTIAADLRRRAEDRLKEKSKRSAAGQVSAEDTQRLVHELQVHQIELEMQNEQLQDARAELAAELRRYSDLYDFAPMGYLTLDGDGAIRGANLTGARLLGRERARLLGERLGIFVSPEFHQPLQATLKRASEVQDKQVCDVELCPEKGTPLWVHMEVVASGRGLRVALVDTTAHHRIQEILSSRIALFDFAAEHSLQELLQKTLDVVGTLTDSPIGFYHFIEPDQKTLSHTAWSTRTVKEFCKAEWHGSHCAIDQAGVWADCVRQRRPFIHNDYASLVHGRELPNGHVAIKRELLAPVLRSNLVVAVIGVGNKPTDYTDNDMHIVAHLADMAWTIIDRKRAEMALQESEARYREAAKALAEADRNKSQFLATLSHELRNPLAPITNSLFILDHAPAGGEQAHRAHAVIGRQVGQLARLVDDLLDATRISGNKLALQLRRVELNDLLRGTLEDHGPEFERNGVRIELRSASESVFVMGDLTRLAQVAGNILGNAAKFTRPGGHMCVTLSTDLAAKQAVIRFADSGAGMDHAMLARLFQPFAQADATLDRSKGGLGLGLALVKGLVDLHGGAVSAHSAGLGQGSEFVVRLPLAPAGAPATETAHPRTLTPVGRRHVLIIEDNVDAADSLREALQLNQHEVAVAYNGPAGIAKARTFKPEIVFCDIGLPGMDGYEVARIFRADDVLKGAYLVALSGYALPEDVQNALESGFDQHLAKPLSLESLDQTLARVPEALSAAT